MVDIDAGIGEVLALTDPTHVRGLLDDVGPLYDPDAPPKFGGEHHFEAPEVHTIPTGPYKTMPRADGSDRAHSDLALCESRLCEITGALDRAALDGVIASRIVPLDGCVQRYNPVVLDLDIGPDGRVRRIHAEGKAGSCAATVIATLAFPPADGPTHATYTLGFP
jgi:hypothetical protein